MKLGLRLHADEEHWIPLSDLMTGLMFLFLLIALAYMVAIQTRHAKPQQVLTAYAQTRTQLSQALDASIGADLRAWGAQFDPATLSVRFYARHVLFAPGSAELQPRFKQILDGFFPRYLAILSDPKYRDVISEVRIEGYTSSLGRPGETLQQRYLSNMQLSQDRARNVLGYVIDLPAARPQRDWLMQVLTANGMSFSHLIRHPNGTEDTDASQRVEFRVRTNADEQVRRLLAVSASNSAAAGLPIHNDAMPEFPPWAQPLLGKPLNAVFSKQTTSCLGYVDGVDHTYAASPPGARIVGWAFDPVKKEPVRRVLIADKRGTIAGVGTGGLTRLDVPARDPAIGSNATGWQAYTGLVGQPATVWAVMSDTAICRLYPTKLSGNLL